MNPIRIIQDAYAIVSRQVSEQVDRLLIQDRERQQRRERYEGEIARGREQLSQSRSRD